MTSIKTICPYVLFTYYLGITAPLLGQSTTHLSEELDRALREMDRYIESPSVMHHDALDKRAPHLTGSEDHNSGEVYDRREFLELGRQIQQLNRRIERKIYETQKLSSKASLLMGHLQKIHAGTHELRIDMEHDPHIFRTIRHIEVHANGIKLFEYIPTHTHDNKRMINIFRGVLPLEKAAQVEIKWTGTHENVNQVIKIYQHKSTHEFNTSQAPQHLILRFMPDKKEVYPLKVVVEKP
ncbi:MAG: hypothetical protein OXT67_01970 [Zetaproteobacteria bacterium]|nr:hypothetical protein [Zetaproteobacteria bacterium]